MIPVQSVEKMGQGEILRKLTIILAVVLCLTLTAGCGAKTDKAGSASATPETSSASGSARITSSETSQFTDYVSYVGDWELVSGENEDLYRIDELLPYHSTTDLNIDEISNGHVKGYIFAGSASVHASIYHMTEVHFEGDIADGKMTAGYDDEDWGTTGSIELVFEEDEISATITRDEQESGFLFGIPKGSFTFLRRINTEPIQLAGDETAQLDKLLYTVTEDLIEPFPEGGLTDGQVIGMLGMNIARGSIELTEFGDKAQTDNETITFDETIMEELSERYFGISIQKHQSVDSVTYADGVYTVPNVGGVSEFPVVVVLLRDTGNDGIYYALADYTWDIDESGYKREYQHLIKPQENGDGYIIKAIEDVKIPLQYGTTTNTVT